MNPLSYDELADLYAQDIAEGNVHTIPDMQVSQPLSYNDLANHFILNHVLINAKPEYPDIEGTKEFHNLIQSLMTEQTRITTETIKQAQIERMARADFLQSIEPELDNIIYSKATTINEFTEQFYQHGKKNGYEVLQRRAFTGNADIHALFNLKSYNFGLIKNLQNDTKEAIRHEIFKGVSHDLGIPEIAKNIERIPIEPIKAGNRVIDVPRRALMIAKTESVRSASQGLQLTFREYGVEFVSSHTRRSRDMDPDECDDYEAHGPYHIDKIPGGGPPYHPECNCYMVPEDEPKSKAEDPGEYFDLTDGSMVTVPKLLMGV